MKRVGVEISYRTKKIDLCEGLRYRKDLDMQKDRSILKIDKVLWKNTTTTTVNVERTYV